MTNITPRLKGYYDALAGKSNKPPSKFRKDAKHEYSEGYLTGAHERRNQVANRPE